MPSTSKARPVFLTHPLFLAPAFGRNHPLSIERHGALIRLCRMQGWLDDAQTRICPLPSVDQLARLHDRAFLEALAEAAATNVASPEVRARYNIGTMECPLFPGLWDRARATVGGARMAARLALAGHVAFHPAGGTHHGQRARASGFCYFNDPAFAILELLDAGLTRIVYADLDAHHGDGVENAYAADPRVMTISIHEADRWPGTGALHDRREGRARNLPVPRGFHDDELAFLMEETVLPEARAFAPQALVITCGTDALSGDPLSGLALSNGALVDAVMALAQIAPHTIVLGGGGYNPWTLARGWALLWAALSGRDTTAPATDGARAVLRSLDCDLIDPEDRPTPWLETIRDTPNHGTIRPEVRAAALAMRRGRAAQPAARLRG